MVTIIATIFVLGVLIFVHELGHFALAKGMGIRVERFSLGFPPKMIGKKLGETEYLISWIPLGGYVKMAGDNPEESLTGGPWEFLSRPRWQRMLVILAGPTMNYLFAFVLIWMLLLVGGILTVGPVVDQVLEGSPAEAWGIKPEDRIVSLDEKDINSWDEIFENLLRKQGKVIAAEVERDGKILPVAIDLRGLGQEEIQEAGITPLLTTEVGEVEKGGPADQAGIRSGDIITAVDDRPVGRWSEMVEAIQGAPDSTLHIRWRRGERAHEAFVNTATYRMPDEQGKMKAVGFIGVTSRVITKRIGILRSGSESLHWILQITEQIVLFIKGLITGQVSVKMVGGPIFIAQVAGQTARQGLPSLLSFMALLSVNLALLNVLPIPVLDGGQLLILVVESIKKRSLSTRQRMLIQQVGLAMIIFLILFVVFNDVTR